MFGLYLQVLRNRRWAHSSVTDPVAARVDEAVDRIIELCDTNADGFVDVSDLAAVTSAASTVPLVPSCMPGGVAAPALLRPLSADEGGDAPASVRQAPPAPLDRLRPTTDSSSGSFRWPPRPHLQYETIGDIVPFLQVRCMTGGCRVLAMTLYPLTASAAQHNAARGELVASASQQAVTQARHRPRRPVGRCSCQQASARRASRGRAHGAVLLFRLGVPLTDSSGCSCSRSV